LSDRKKLLSQLIGAAFLIYYFFFVGPTVGRVGKGKKKLWVASYGSLALREISSA
jgi:hypothetical protein